MNNAPERPITYDDEINLIDLAATFIRRRRAFYGVFLVVVLAAVVYLLISRSEPASIYTTVVQLPVLPAMNGPESEAAEDKKPTERTATLVATIESRWRAEASDLYQAAHGHKMPVTINVDSVEYTELIRLRSTGANEDEVSRAHELLASLIVKNQNEQLKKRMVVLSRQISGLGQIIDNYGPDSVVAAQAIETRSELEQVSVTAQPAEVLALASASEGQAGGPSTRLVLAIGIILGLVLGVLAAFLAEFVAQVRCALGNESQAKPEGSWSTAAATSAAH